MQGQRRVAVHSWRMSLGVGDPVTSRPSFEVVCPLQSGSEEQAKSARLTPWVVYVATLAVFTPQKITASLFLIFFFERTSSPGLCRLERTWRCCGHELQSLFCNLYLREFRSPLRTSVSLLPNRDKVTYFDRQLTLCKVTFD